MPEALDLDPARSALLVMDYQKGILANNAGLEADKLLERAARVLGAARGAGLRVIYIKVGFRAGYPEASPRNKSFGSIQASGRFSPDDPNAQIHPAVAPGPEEPVVVKHRVGPFLGTDLDMILRAKGVENLVLCGVATSGVVLSTVRYAADADYRLFVVKDCCADARPDVHACLIDKVFPRQAEVIDAEGLIAALTASTR